MKSLSDQASAMGRRVNKGITGTAGNIVNITKDMATNGLTAGLATVKGGVEKVPHQKGAPLNALRDYMNSAAAGMATIGATRLGGVGDGSIEKR
jgi:hypothetical protein